MDFRVLDSITVVQTFLLKFYRHEKLGFLSFCPNVNFSLFLLQMWHYRMIVISIIILLALLFYLFYNCSPPHYWLDISSILFLVADYNGRYYGLSPIIFNPVRLPQDVSIMIDRYYNFYITGEYELEIFGPGFRCAGTHVLVESIQDYSVKDSTLYIRCMTDQGIEIYRLDKGDLFCKTGEINNACWRTHLIENYKIFTFIRIMSVLLFLIGISLTYIYSEVATNLSITGIYCGMS